MDRQFAPGDYLLFQLESGFGLLRILAIEGEGPQTSWHIMAYDEFFASSEDAEAAVRTPGSLHTRKAHMALTDRAFERTPAARIANQPLTKDDLNAFEEWKSSGGMHISDRSALLQLGIR